MHGLRRRKGRKKEGKVRQNGRKVKIKKETERKAG